MITSRKTAEKETTTRRGAERLSLKTTVSEQSHVKGMLLKFTKVLSFGHVVSSLSDHIPFRFCIIVIESSELHPNI